MRFTSTLLRRPLFRRWRFRLLDFFVRICRNPCFLYFTFPFPVTEYRFAADFLVFIFGIVSSLFSAKLFFPFGGNHHRHESSFHARFFFKYVRVPKEFQYLVQYQQSPIRMG